MKKVLAVAAVALVGMSGVGLSDAAQARDQIRIVGSSTVYPFSIAVADQFGKAGKFKTPVVESTGTGGGFKLFCAGVGEGTVDISNASRRIKQSEVDSCAKNGVGGIAEVKIGYDGIVIASAKAHKPMTLTRDQLYRALAKVVPVNGALVPNPNKTWKDVDASLPAEKIEVLGPPTTSGTRDAFVELVMDVGCAPYPEIKALTDSKVKAAACQAIREDGAYVEVGEDDNLVVQRLAATPSLVGIFGYSFLEQNLDRVQGNIIDGKDPTFENIASGAYPLSRSMYFYVKKAHIGKVPGITEFVDAFTSEKAWGDDGYLATKGLIPLPEKERKEEAARAKQLTDLVLTK